MKGACHGNRSSDHFDADCTASLKAAQPEEETGCSSFSYKNRFQGSTRDLTQRFLSSTSNHASKSSFSHSINECKLCLVFSSSGASGSISTIPFSLQPQPSSTPPQTYDLSEQRMMSANLHEVYCRTSSQAQQLCGRQLQDYYMNCHVSTSPQWCDDTSRAYRGR